MHYLKENWVLLLILLLVAIIGGLLTHYPIPELDFDLTKAVGHALIVAAILGATVDIYVKKRLVKEVSQDTFKYLVGFRLPEELQNKIQEIVEIKLIRSNWHFHYKISPIQENPDRIKLEASLKCFMENISDQDQDYEQGIFLDKHVQPKILELRCDSSDKDACYVLNEKSLETQSQQRAQAKESWFTEAVGKKLKLKPKKHDAKLWYEFTARFSQVLPTTWSDYFTFDSPGIPTKKVTITAEYPDGFQFKASGKEVNKDRWEDERIFLSGEKISIWWQKIQ